MKTLVQTKHSKTFVLYREEMVKLIEYPGKPLHEQLCIELPCLMGFRATEITTWRAEWIDFEHGTTLVLDAKKKKLFRIPLNNIVAGHVEKLLKGRREGYVLRSRSTRNRGDQIGPASVWHVWKKWAFKARLFNPEEFSPIVGRRFFAAYWYHYLRLSLIDLSKIMRHSEPRVTLGYVETLIFFEDMMREYRQFQFSFLQKSVERPLTLNDLHRMIDDLFSQFMGSNPTKETRKRKVAQKIAV